MHNNNELRKKKTFRIAHIDDNPFELKEVKKILMESKLDVCFEVSSFVNPIEFNNTIKELKNFDMIVIDVNLGEEEDDGIQLAKKLKAIYQNVVIIIYSNNEHSEIILDSFKYGADDFITKNSLEGELDLRLLNAYYHVHNDEYSSHTNNYKLFSKIHGDTMKKIIRRVPNILESAIKSVFVFGESGVGKEVVANIFEEYLRKQTKTLLRVNCASFTSSLLTSELFGYEKGAFTGAMKTKIGIFEKADNGWIFLDEVTTLSLDAQCSLLRVLESQEIRRVGSNKSIKINVKIVCATNENVEELIKAGKFREDLWQRLQEVIISIPPLRERPDEMDAIIDGLCKTIEGGPYKITASTKSLLKSLKWEKGNIRELRNCLRAMTENYLSKENIFTPISIPTRVWDKINSKNKYENDEISSKISFDINKYNKPYRALKKELLYTLILKFIKGNNEKLKLATLASKIGVSKTILARSLEEGVKEGRLRKDDIINSVWINV